MPLYDYECDHCHKKEERIVPSDSKVPEECSCGYSMTRLISCPKIVPGYQPGVILGNGAKVAGHFGTAKKHKGGHRP